ncbi:hypothetical protein LOTGIDRAFT_157016 [Lottia gigantea]|uniref:Protein quiver n=1 Tax=Lottia gigantea TaxID=225164 RepID=V4CL96_LOTGI|nr:hypothetical protein LOTGIDRAFT_157016 [Lottia gigantea]ESP03055.1 hypothetical protein LOTGIDRAFT_157016 [Lottia gigantea]
MESLPKTWTKILLLCAVFTVSQSVERYVCRTCQYQSNMKDTSCIYEAENMTEIQNNVKCPGLCLIQSRWDKETMLPTFLLRGCSNLPRETEDVCNEDVLGYECLSQCSGHYCNVDLGLTPGGSQRAASRNLVVAMTFGFIFLVK